MWVLEGSVSVNQLLIWSPLSRFKLFFLSLIAIPSLIFLSSVLPLSLRWLGPMQYCGLILWHGLPVHCFGPHSSLPVCVYSYVVLAFSPSLLFTEEKNHLQEVFEANSYPPELVQRYLSKKSKKSTKQDDEEEEKNPDTLFLPYVQGLSEKIEKQIKDINIRAVFIANRTLRSYLMKVKTPRNSHGRSQRCSVLNTMWVWQRVHRRDGENANTTYEWTQTAVKNGDQNNALAASPCQTIKPRTTSHGTKPA